MLLTLRLEGSFLSSPRAFPLYFPVLPFRTGYFQSSPVLPEASGVSGCLYNRRNLFSAFLLLPELHPSVWYIYRTHAFRSSQLSAGKLSPASQIRWMHHLLLRLHPAGLRFLRNHLQFHPSESPSHLPGVLLSVLPCYFRMPSVQSSVPPCLVPVPLSDCRLFRAGSGLLPDASWISPGSLSVQDMPDHSAWSPRIPVRCLSHRLLPPYCLWSRLPDSNRPRWCHLPKLWSHPADFLRKLDKYPYWL